LNYSENPLPSPEKIKVFKTNKTIILKKNLIDGSVKEKKCVDLGVGTREWFKIFINFFCICGGFFPYKTFFPPQDYFCPSRPTCSPGGSPTRLFVFLVFQLWKNNGAFLLFFILYWNPGFNIFCIVYCNIPLPTN